MARERSHSMDMLNGPMLKRILLFALPLAAGSILQQLFNAVDVVVVGRFASSEALAAVGANTSVVALLINWFVGISVGSNVLIANLIGRRENDRIGKAVHTSLLLAVVSGLCLMVIGIGIARPLLGLMSTPDNIMDMAVLYLRIYCVGTPFILLYNFSAAILRSIGDTRRPLICLLVGGVTNAGLNLVFVIIFHMSVAGVAIATVISNIVSSSLAVIFLVHSDPLIRPQFRKLRFHKEELIQILKIGVPAGIQSVVFSISNVVIQSSINSFGSDAVAGCSVTSNFEYINYYLVNGFNATVMTFISQNLGAGNLRRCRKAYGLCISSAAVCVAILCGAFLLLRVPLVGIFTQDPAVAQVAIQRMTITISFDFLICSYEVTGAAMRGLGHSLVPALIAVCGTCLLRILYVSTIVPRFHTFRVLLSVYPITWAATGIIMIVGFCFVWRKVKRKLEAERNQ